MQKVYVADVVESETSRKNLGHQFSGYVVLLAVDSGRRALPISVGRDSASAIAISARVTSFPRPLSYVFMQSILDAVGGTVDQITIERLYDSIFYAIVRVSGKHGHGEIDARPSDAIALATHVNCPIFVSDEIMDRAGIDVPSVTALGHGIDALVTEFEERVQRPIRAACLTVDEKYQADRRLVERVFGKE